MMLGVKTGCRGGERALLCARLILQQVNKEWSGSVVEEVESFDLAFSTCVRFLDLTLFFFSKVPVHVDDSADDFSNFEKWQKDTTEWVCGSTKQVPLSYTGSISWKKQKKNKNKNMRNSDIGAGKLRLSTHWSCHKLHWGVRQCVSYLCEGWGATTLIIKHCILFGP